MEHLASLFRGVSSAYTWTLEDKLRSIVAESKKQLVGLCLECERSGDIKERREDCDRLFRS